MVPEGFGRDPWRWIKHRSLMCDHLDAEPQCISCWLRMLNRVCLTIWYPYSCDEFWYPDMGLVATYLPGITMTYTFLRQHTTCGCVCGRCFWQGGRTTQVGFDCLLLLLAWRLKPIWKVCSKFFMVRIRIMQLIMIHIISYYNII